MSATPSLLQLKAHCYWLGTTPIRCHRESLQDSATLHFVGSHNGNGIWKTDCTWMLSYKIGLALWNFS